jgi:hypothetical protein
MENPLVKSMAGEIPPKEAMLAGLQPLRLKAMEMSQLVPSHPFNGTCGKDVLFKLKE